MIYLLLGGDDFSKKEFLLEIAAKDNLELLNFYSEQELPQILQAALNGGLFGRKKMVRLHDMLAKIYSPELISKLATSGDIIVFLEQNLDKRKSETKNILADSNLVLKEFTVPTGAEFKKWVESRAKKYSLKFSNGALELFLQKLGLSYSKFDGVLYDLWQADSELKKLKTYAGQKEVTREDIDLLTTENVDENVFKITNAIADKNKQLVIRFLTDYMDRLPGTDEKAKVISLVGLLADQFRGILIVQGMAGAPDSETAALSGYSPARLAVYRRIAQRFSKDQLLTALQKMVMLDREIKTSGSPAALQFYMIINTMFA